MTSAAASEAPSRTSLVARELAKLPAFLRRDILIALSYRVAFVSDLASLLVQALLFYFLSELVNPGEVPRIDGTQPTYLEFVTIGIALSVFVQLGLGRVAAVFRGEQLAGTLESMLTTPTALATVQLGAVVFDLVYVPLRTAVFLGAMVLAFDVDLHAGGLLPATALLLAFMPFVWGLGVLSAAAIVTFRKGAGVAGIAGTFLTLGSGAYFPLSLLPGWVESLATVNPIAIALEGMRELLLGDAGWPEALSAAAVLLPLSAATLALGVIAFRAALRHEQKRGTLGLY